MTRKRRRVPADNHGDKPDRDCKLPFEHSPWPSLIDMDMRTAVEADYFLAFSDGLMDQTEIDFDWIID